MKFQPIGPLKVRAEVERWLKTKPFRIASYTFQEIDVLVVSLEKEGQVGRGEAFGVYYRNENAASMLKQFESLRGILEAGISRSSLQELLPSCGLRNAIDCALWDLQAKLSGRPAWRIAGLEKPQPLLTTFTCSADSPERMAAAATAFAHARAIKIKLTGDPIDAERVSAVREARQDVWLGVDANQGFTRASLDQLMAVLVEARVALVEQPFPIGHEAMLDGFQAPIPVAADESVQGLASIPGLVGRFDVINIKLDKCGGLTEALAILRDARTHGLDTMVGCMPGTSLAMAPAFLVGQFCKVVDLDAPVSLRADRAVCVQYADGFLTCPGSLWGE